MRKNQDAWYLLKFSALLSSVLSLLTAVFFREHIGAAAGLAVGTLAVNLNFFLLERRLRSILKERAGVSSYLAFYFLRSVLLAAAVIPLSFLGPGAVIGYLVPFLYPTLSFFIRRER